ncbi:hypothetical protein KAX22_05610, partial [bacterium]|nr:hypothetical protein [bacterium]
MADEQELRELGELGELERQMLDARYWILDKGKYNAKAEIRDSRIEIRKSSVQLPFIFCIFHFSFFILHLLFVGAVGWPH